MLAGGDGDDEDDEEGGEGSEGLHGGRSWNRKEVEGRWERERKVFEGEGIILNKWT